MEETKTGLGWAGLLLIFVVVWILFGSMCGGGFGFGGFGGNCGNRNGWGCVTTCEIEKQGIIDSARNLYAIEQQGSATRAAGQAGFAEVMAQNNRIYEQSLQERIFDLKIENNSLKNNYFVKEQTDALAKMYSDCCCELNRRLDAIECKMLVKPSLYGVASTCSGQIIPSITSCPNV